MKLTNVDSTMISKAGYDAESQTLRVAFLNNGKLVDYMNVPEYVYHDLLAAKSKGTYMSNFVISCYEHQDAKEGK